MKKTIIALFLLIAVAASAQKPRPDAFDPQPDTLSPKAVVMATTLEEMDAWDRYPTYEVYVAMMQRLPTITPNSAISTPSAPQSKAASSFRWQSLGRHSPTTTAPNSSIPPPCTATR